MRLLMTGICDAASEIGIPVTGGETEVIRGIFENSQTINVAAAVFGWREVSKLITGEKVGVGDSLCVLPSSGVHTNGFSEIVDRFSEIDLAETLFNLSGNSDHTVAEWLAKPTVNYLPDIKLLREAGIEIKGAENVTGGGFSGRLLNLLGDSQLQAKTIRDSMPVPAIFDYLQEKFEWSNYQMFTTFNMGAGMFLVIDKNDCQRAIEAMCEAGRKIYPIGVLEK